MQDTLRITGQDTRGVVPSRTAGRETVDLKREPAGVYLRYLTKNCRSRSGGWEKIEGEDKSYREAFYFSDQGNSRNHRTVGGVDHDSPVEMQEVRGPKDSRTRPQGKRKRLERTIAFSRQERNDIERQHGTTRAAQRGELPKRAWHRRGRGKPIKEDRRLPQERGRTERMVSWTDAQVKRTARLTAPKRQHPSQSIPFQLDESAKQRWVAQPKRRNQPQVLRQEPGRQETS